MRIRRNKNISLPFQKDCTGCMACADACRHEALKILTCDDGHKYPMVDDSKCIACGACEKACPIHEKLPYGNNFGKSIPFAAWCTDKELITRSASGGVFAAVAAQVLSAGGYVSGAVSIGKDVKHIVIDSLKDLHLLQGSKYLQSDTRGVYKQVKKLLIDGNTVLFSGTGCQVAGILQYLGKKYDRLITIDLICAGVPSSLLMSRFCEEENLNPEHIRWRDKENGWRHGLQLTITTNNQKNRWKTKNCFFWGGFLGGMTSRWSCYNCHFTGTDRISDLTIGDYWGCQEWKEQWHDGVSVLIAHSPKGRELVESSKLAIRPTSWADCVRENPRIILGRRPMQELILERKMIAWAFKHLSYETLNKIYAGNIQKRDILWLPYKLFKMLRWQLTQFITKKRVKTILKNL